MAAFIERSSRLPGGSGQALLKLRYRNLGILIQARTRLPIFAIAKIKIAPPRHAETLHTGKPLSHVSGKSFGRECSGAFFGLREIRCRCANIFLGGIFCFQLSASIRNCLKRPVSKFESENRGLFSFTQNPSQNPSQNLLEICTRPRVPFFNGSP